jgi:hypothetical protein
MEMFRKGKAVYIDTGCSEHLKSRNFILPCLTQKLSLSLVLPKGHSKRALFNRNSLISLTSFAAGVSSVTGRPPRVIYIIPSGQNPTGAVMSVERKHEIYEVRTRASYFFCE